VRSPTVTVEDSPVEFVAAAWATEAPVTAATPTAATSAHARTDVLVSFMSTPPCILKVMALLNS
jgi:hypothetical protein